MIHNSTSSPSYYTSKKTQFYQIVFEQDAIFSGVEYLTSTLENSENISWYIKDGECILKGQTCMEIFQEIEGLNEMIKVISYLSGISTLARCYTELSNDTPIIGSPVKDSPLFEWEIKSLFYGGVDIKPHCPEKIYHLEEDLNLKDSVIALNSNIPRDKLKSLLKKIPSQKIKGLYGSILPRDLKKFNDLPINVIWPEILQGPFPLVKIKIHGNK